MPFPSDLTLKAIYLLDTQGRGSWDEWTWNKGRVLSQDGVDVRLVEYVPDDTQPDAWGEYPEGYAGTHSVVLEVTGPGDERVLLRKDGSVSSYGTKSWDGPLYEVRAVEKTVMAYEKVSA